MRNIETKRLILRNFTEGDYSDLYEFLSQRKDDNFEGYPDITYENGRSHLAYRQGNDEFVAVVLKEENKVIGNIYLGKKEYNTLELGYIINKNYMRHGYATEAIKALICEAEKNQVHRIYAECDPRNTCSVGLLESLGFKREGYFKQNVYFGHDEFGNPLWQDTYVYAKLLKDNTLVDSFWDRFLSKTNRPTNTTYLSAFYFELTEKLANELMELVLKGQKKATASSLISFEIENEELPKIGDLSIVTDFAGNPRCVIETSRVRIFPYKDITFDIAKLEGEDDNLLSWQKGHQRFFEEEGKLLGYSFNEDLLVVFEEFEVIYQE